MYLLTCSTYFNGFRFTIWILGTFQKSKLPYKYPQEQGVDLNYQTTSYQFFSFSDICKENPSGGFYLSAVFTYPRFIFRSNLALFRPTYLRFHLNFTYCENALLLYIQIILDTPCDKCGCKNLMAWANTCVVMGEKCEILSFTSHHDKKRIVLLFLVFNFVCFKIREVVSISSLLIGQ